MAAFFPGLGAQEIIILFVLGGLLGLNQGPPATGLPTLGLGLIGAAWAAFYVATR